MAHEGYTSAAISQELGVSVQTVSQWRQRIARQGAQGIREAERSGRPPRITQGTRLQLIALACEVQEAQGRVTPTLDEIVTRAVERGLVEQSVAAMCSASCRLATFARIGYNSGCIVQIRPFARRSR
jgi:transposase